MPCHAVQFDTFFPSSSSSSSSKHYLFTYIKWFSMKHLSLRIVNMIKQQHAIQTQILCNVEIHNIFNCSQRDYIFSFHSLNSSSIEWFWFCCEKKREKIIKSNKVVLLFYQNEWMILIRLGVLIIKTDEKKLEK